MSAELLLLAFVLLVATSVLVHAVFLWLGCRWWKVAARFRRVLLVALGVVVLTAILRAAAAWGFEQFGRGPSSQPSMLTPAGQNDAVSTGAWLVLLSELAAILACLWALLKWGLRTSWAKASLAGLTMLLPSMPLMLAVVLGFRAAVAEAFVIPTGAMAPALIGSHADVVCQNCSLPYQVSLSERVYLPPDQVGHVIRTACPNCAHPIDILPGAEILGGDRILVEKLSRPRRWDLVVFPVPDQPWVPFVDRLVVLPGERFEIAGGDLFVDGRRLKRPPHIAPEMSVLVADSRYVPREVDPESRRWQADEGSGWNKAAGAWTYDGRGAGRLVFSGTITDEFVYNGHYGHYEFEEPASGAPVADVCVQCTTGAAAGTASLGYEWRFADRRVRALVSGAGEVRLTVHADDDDASVAPREAHGRLAGSLADSELSFMVRDGDAMVVQNGRALARVTVLPDDLELARALLPPVEQSRSWRNPQEDAGCELSLVGEGGRIELSRIRVLRDVYYATLEELGYPPGSFALDQLKSETGFPGADRLQLGPDECFALGDNSRRSKDCRFFGPVRFDTIIGVVRCIYWPPGRWNEFE